VPLWKLHFLFKERSLLIVVLKRSLGLPLLVLEDSLARRGLAKVGGVGRIPRIFLGLLLVFGLGLCNRLFSIILISAMTHKNYRIN
jgi:hypothetical protein